MEGNWGKMEGGEVNMFLRISRLYPKQENVSDINIYYSNYLSLNMSVVFHKFTLRYSIRFIGQTY